MKTLEIKLNRSRCLSYLIALLCLAMIVVMVCPYFTYGTDATNLVPENPDAKTQGDQTILYGRTWVLSGSDETKDGYQKIEVDKDGKKDQSTLYTTNILRVNQKSSMDVFNDCLEKYNHIAEQVEKCDEYVHECEVKLEALISDANKVAAKLGKPGFNAEAIEAAAEKEATASNEETAEAAETAAPTETPAADAAETASQADVDYKALTDAINKAQKELVKAEGFYNTALTSKNNAKAALENSVKAVKAAYDKETIDASYAWVTETTDAYNAALSEAYPEAFEAGYAETNKKDFLELLKTEYAEHFDEINNREKKERKPDEKLYTELMEGYEDAARKIKYAPLTAEEKATLYHKFYVQTVGDKELTQDEINAAIDKTKDEIAKTLSDEARDEKVYGTLNAMKAASQKAMTLATQASKDAAAANKTGEKKATTDKAAKLPANIEKQDKVIKDLFKQYGIAEEETTDDQTPDAYQPEAMERYTAESFEVDGLEEAQTEDMLMKSKCTVAYKKGNNDTIGKVTITFANGNVKNTTFGTSLNYDGKQQASLMGFVGFPEDLKDTLEKEISRKNFGYDRNSAVLIPILLFILLIIGLVLAIIKRDSFGSAICPLAAGIIGVIAYLTSEFLKSGDGDAYTLHTIGFAILLVVSCLQLYFGIKEKVAEKEDAIK